MKTLIRIALVLSLTGCSGAVMPIPSPDAGLPDLGRDAGWVEPDSDAGELPGDAGEPDSGTDTDAGTSEGTDSGSPACEVELVTSWNDTDKAACDGPLSMIESATTFCAGEAPWSIRFSEACNPATGQAWMNAESASCQNLFGATHVFVIDRDARTISERNTITDATCTVRFGEE